MSTSIEWCDEVWNPLVGCTRVSAGCENCYAIGVAARQMSPQHRGLTKVRPKGAKRPGPDWTGEVRTVPAKLAEPLRWRKPRRVFVNSMSDLFHAQVPFEYIAAVFGVMAACPQHTFLVLTKRPERAREFFDWIVGVGSKGYVWQTMFVHAQEHVRIAELEGRMGSPWPWPLPNVQLGTSVEDQASADKRIPEVLACPAALHWVSLEPLLDEVDLHLDINGKAGPHLQWVVVGGELGPGARPFHLDWARSVIEQCRESRVPVFVKQLGAMPRQPASAVEEGGLGTWTLKLAHRKGGDVYEWPADLQIRQLPGSLQSDLFQGEP